MARLPESPSDAVVLAEQAAYYRARAAEYDEWWFRTGRYDRGAAFNASWNAEVAAVESTLADWLDARRPVAAVELACGTGLFTRHLAPRCTRVLALDASPEVLAINRARAPAANVSYAQQDLFAWIPTERFDLVFMSFWLSHVPASRFDVFWRNVRAALAPGGMAYVIDSAFEPSSTAVDHARPERDTGVVTRKLNDGREFRIVKIFHEPAALNARLAGLGLRAAMARTPRFFIHGAVAAA